LRIGAAGPKRHATITQNTFKRSCLDQPGLGLPPISIGSSRRRYLPIKFFGPRNVISAARVRESPGKGRCPDSTLPPGSRLRVGRPSSAICRTPSSGCPIVVTDQPRAGSRCCCGFNFGSMVDTLLAMSVIPMAIFGGRAWPLDIRGFPFSVSAAIGFYRACSAIAVMDGIIIPVANTIS